MPWGNRLLGTGTAVLPGTLRQELPGNETDIADEGRLPGRFSLGRSLRRLCTAPYVRRARFRRARNARPTICLDGVSGVLAGGLRPPARTVRLPDYSPRRFAPSLARSGSAAPRTNTRQHRDWCAAADPRRASRVRPDQTPRAGAYALQRLRRVSPWPASQAMTKRWRVRSTRSRNQAAPTCGSCAGPVLLQTVRSCRFISLLHYISGNRASS